MRTITRVHFYFLMLLALFVHLTLLHYCALFGVTPDLLFCLVVFAALFGSPGMGLEAGIAAGLAKDIFSADALGTSAVLFGLAGYLVGKIGPRFYRESAVTQFLIVCVFYIFSASAFYIFKFVFPGSFRFLRDSTPGYGLFFARWIVPSSVYTAVVSLVLFRRLMRFFNVEGLSLL